MQKKGNKKAAIELSIGTIVILVLSMSMLILGLVLLRTIFGGAEDVANMNNDQISAAIADLYGDDERLAILPNVDILEIQSGEQKAIAISLRNLLENVDSSTVRFTYETIPDDFRECGLNERQILDWMKGDKSSEPITIPAGGENIEKVLITVPEGTSLCTFKLRFSAEQNNQPYDNAQIFIKITA